MVKKSSKPLFPYWATIFTIIGISFLCALGFWQLKRLHWKENLLLQLNAAKAQASHKILSSADLKKITKAHPAFAFASLRGHFRETKSILVQPRTFEGNPGYHFLTPFVLQDGTAILVNRGWLPLDQKKFQGKNTGTVTVRGMLRPVQSPNIFTPPNEPVKGEWFSIDLPAMAKITGTHTFFPYVLYESYESGVSGKPVRQALEWQPANNHLAYAFFWFGMASVLTAIYWLRFIRPNQ